MLGIGGGGDVVGALAVAEPCRRVHGARPVVGGVTWERRPIDPRPGPRSLAEIEGAEPLAEAIALAGPDTRAGDVRFAESHMARLLGESTVLVDVNPGPAAVARGLAGAADTLGADLVVLVDVGGDALAAGDEPGLASPLCDAVMLAAGRRLAEDGMPVLGAVFGIGCDGELRPAEVLERLAAVAAAGALAGARGLTGPVAETLVAAVEAVPTEASAQALRCYRGERGEASIRGGRRSVELSPLGALTVFFDVSAAMPAAAPLAAAVDGAYDLDDASRRLNAIGVRTELDLERGPPPV